MTTRSISGLAPLASLLALSLCAPGALADKIRHPTAVFAGLDKITGRVISFEVAGEETVQFGSLQVTAHACYTRPPTEPPQTTGFVEVEEVIDKADNKKVFSGWMFAASPGLHGVEHPVYDVWLTDCKGGSTVIKETVALPEENILSPQPPKPGTVPRPRTGVPQARTPGQPGFPGPTGLPGQPGLTGPLDAALPPANVAPQPQRPRAGPVPPGSIPTAQVAPQRRAPSQSFFPTFSNSGESQRDRERAIERARERE